MKVSTRATALIATLSLAAAACGSQTSSSSGGGTQTDVGITSTEIHLGSIFPVSGSASAYYSVAKGANAYFEYVNTEKGGVNGRKIKYLVADDAYTPANTPAKARQLVQEDKVFLTFGNLGTPTNLAVRDERAVQLADMTRLHALSERLPNSLELPSVLAEVLEAVTGLQGTGAGVLMLYDADRDTLTTSASVATPWRIASSDGLAKQSRSRLLP